MKVGKWTVIEFISIIIPENQKAEIDFKNIIGKLLQ